MRVRVASLAVVSVLFLVLARSAPAQVSFVADFDSVADETYAEQLTYPGIVFSSSPSSIWQVYPTFFQNLTGKVLIQPSSPGTLGVAFSANVRTVGFVFAMNASPGATSLRVDAYNGQTLVGSVTQQTATSGSLGFGEGVVLLSTPQTFNRIQVSAVPSDTLMAIDYLVATDSTGCPPLTTAPTLTTPSGTTAIAGRTVGVSWQAPAGLQPTGRYLVETSYDSAFSPLDASFYTASSSAVLQVGADKAGSTYYVRVRAQQSCGNVSPASDALALPVTAAPASFVPVVSTISLTASQGGSLPSAPLTFRNVGGTVGTLNLSATTGWSLSTTSLRLNPGDQGTVTVGATSSLLASTGVKKGTVTGTVSNQSLSIPLACTVTPQLPPQGSHTGTKVVPSTATVVFSAPSGQNPPPQTITLNVPAVVGSGAVYLIPTIGPGGAWLDLSGSFTQPISGPSTVSMTLTIDRSKRSAYDGVAPFRTLVNVKAGGASDDDVAVIEVVDLEPASTSAGAGPRGNSVGGLAVGSAWRRVSAQSVVPPANGKSFIVPTAVKAQGSGSFFSSDGWLKNQGSAAASVEFYFTPDSKNGLTDPSVVRSTKTLPPGATFRLSELLPSLFGVSGVSGQVELRSPDAANLALRTTVESITGGDATSRYGTEIPTVSYGSGVGLADPELVIPGISEDASNRTNLILSETTGNPANVLVTVWNANGQSVGTTTASLLPYGKTQLNQVVVTAGAGTLTGGSLAIKVTSGAGKVVAVATVIDNKSGSFSAVKGRVPTATVPPAARAASGSADQLAATAPSLVVPSAARLTGAYNTQFTTSLASSNGTAQSAFLTLTYHYIDVADGSKPKTVTKTYTIPPRGSLPKSVGGDVIASLFGITTPSYGWIEVTGDVTRIIAVSAVSALVDATNPAKGVKTAQVDGVLTTSPDVMGNQELERRFAGTEKSVQRRTNLILVEVTGQPCTVLVSLVGADGSPLSQKTVTVQGGQYFQINDVFGPNGLGLGDGPFQNVEVTARVTGGTGRIVAVATVNDNVSRNPEIFVLKAPGTPPPAIGF